MERWVLLESVHGSQSSARVATCTCAFLPSSSSSVTLPVAWIKGSVAFPRGFPTGLSHVPPWCESILGVKIEAVQGKEVPWKALRHPGVSLNGGRTVESLSHFLWRAPPLEMRRERREFFPDQAGKDPSSRATRRKRGSSGCARDPRASSRVEKGMSENDLRCSKSLKDPLEVPEVRRD